MRNSKLAKTARIGLVLILLAVAGCMSKKSHPSINLEHQIYPTGPAVSEAEMGRLLARKVVLPSHVSVGVAWMNQRASDFDALPDAERGRLLAHFAESMEEPPVSRAVVLPTTPARGRYWFAGREAAAIDDTLGELRTAAARFQSDVLVIINTSTNEYVDWNPLALTYLAILPMYLFPGDDLAVYASVEACAIDIRTGVFLGCAQGQSEHGRKFVPWMRRDAGMRDLTVAALDGAFEEIPRGLRTQIHQHVGGLVFPPAHGAVVPRGPRYRTAR